MKLIIKDATRIVTFFNNSHYWGGQLKEESKRLKINCSLKKNVETRFYSLSLQCTSVLANRSGLCKIVVSRSDLKKPQKHSHISLSSTRCTEEDRWAFSCGIRRCGNCIVQTRFLVPARSIDKDHQATG